MINLAHPETGRTLFSHAELATRDTLEVRLATGFAEELIRLRVLFGRPMHVTSCSRTQAHNREVRGHPRSLHLMDNPVHDIDGTAAIDVRVDGGSPAVRGLVVVALRLGWSVGLAKSFVHLDYRALANLPPAAFGY